MYSVIQNILQYSGSSQYPSTFDQYVFACSCALVLILTIITADWLRTLFKALVNKIR